MNPNILPQYRDVIERAEVAYERFYAGQRKEDLERTAWGKYVAFHIDTDDYVVADTQAEAVAQFHARFPGALACTRRIGIPRLVA